MYVLYDHVSSTGADPVYHHLGGPRSLHPMVGICTSWRRRVLPSLGPAASDGSSMLGADDSRDAAIKYSEDAERSSDGGRCMIWSLGPPHGPSVVGADG